MTKQETYRILALMQANYADTHPSQTDLEAKASLWAAQFADTPVTIVEAAVMAYIANDSEGRFMPTVGAIKNEVAKLMPSSSENLSEAEAWGFVYAAIRNSAYNAKEEYEKLPQSVQRAVGNWHILQEWATDPHFSTPVTSSNFMRSFRETREQEKRLSKLPPMVRDRMEHLANSAVSALCAESKPAELPAAPARQGEAV